LGTPPKEIEQIAQHYAARLIVNRSESKDNQQTTDYQEVDVASLELVRPRSIGVEHVGLEAIKSLNTPKILEKTGFNKVQRGHSKEKRSDCPLVTRGLVLDGSGFVRGSQMFEGNVSEYKTLKTMLDKLKTPKSALVIMDQGIATQTNIDWLIEHHYRYLVVSRERTRSYNADQAVDISTALDHPIKIHRGCLLPGNPASNKAIKRINHRSRHRLVHN